MARYRFLFICVPLLFFLPNFSFAQWVLKGSVVDAQSKEVLPGAVVKALGKVAVTNGEGEFELTFTENRPTDFVIRVSYVGYEEKQFQGKDFLPSLPVVLRISQGEKMLDMLLISAGRFEQSVKRMVVSTEIIKPYLIQNKNTTMMDDLLEQIPSVNVVDGQINIRSGSGWTYGAGSRVAVLLDDMPFLTGDAGNVKWNFVPIENVQQVEVVKGASSVLYGSGALSGIVHFRTEMSTGKPITRFNVFSGIFSEPQRSSLTWRSSPALQYGVNGFHSFKHKKLSAAFSGNYFKDEGYRLGETDHRLRLNTNLKYQWKDKVSLALNSGILFSDGSSFLLWESYEKGYTILDSQVTNTLSKNIYVDPSVSFYTGTFKHQVRGRFMYISNDNQTPDPNVNQDNTSYNIYGEYLVQNYFEKLHLMVNAGVMHSQSVSESPLYSGLQKSNNQALFLQLDKSIRQKINLSLGARYEHFSMNGKAEGKPVFRSGVNYELFSSTFLRASFGQGYRFPSIAERYIQTSVGLLNIFPNPNLQSETGWNAEFGIKQGFTFKGVKGFADVAYFYTRYQNMIDFNLGFWRPFDFNDPFKSFGFMSLNIGETQITGWDFSLNAEGKMGKIKVQTILGYTYTNPTMLNIDEVFATDSLGYSYSFRNTRSDSISTLKYRFKHLFKWDVQFSYGRYQLGYSLKYNSAMQNIDAAFVQLPLTAFIQGVKDGRNANANGNTLMDIRASYQISNKLKLSLVVNNLLNVEVMTRPADLRPPRLTLVQFNYTL